MVCHFNLEDPADSGSVLFRNAVSTYESTSLGLMLQIIHSKVQRSQVKFLLNSQYRIKHVRGSASQWTKISERRLTSGNIATMWNFWLPAVCIIAITSSLFLLTVKSLFSRSESHDSRQNKYQTDRHDNHFQFAFVFFPLDFQLHLFFIFVIPCENLWFLYCG
jgi:hypothetical protein